jgi:hypothetical protein
MVFCGIAVVLSQKVPKGEKHWNPLGPKQKSALELYDNLREKVGFDAWDVVYHSKNNGASEFSGCGICLTRGLHLTGPLAGTANQSGLVQVQSRKVTHVNVRIPHVNPSPPSSTDKEEHEDWKTSLDEFQEWLGLACMGSQR